MNGLQQMFTSLRGGSNELLDRRYEIQAQLGHGGQGTVFRAFDQIESRSVAVKLLNDPNDANQRFRFEQEIRNLAAIEFPSIVPIYRHGRTRWQGRTVHYFAMRLEEGQTLQDRIARSKKPLHPSSCIRIALEVLGALDYAHRLGIVHRDLKPSNIIQRTQGVIVLVDFGIATAPDAVTKSTLIFATPNYAAPERFDPNLVSAYKGIEATSKLDVFSLGIILYEMLTLLPASLIRDRPPALHEVNPDVSPALGMVVHKAMARKPEHRLTVQEFTEALNEVSRGEPRVSCINPVSVGTQLSDINHWLARGDAADLNNAVAKIRELEDEGWCFGELLQAKKIIAEHWLEEARRLRSSDEQLILTKLSDVLRFSYRHSEAIRMARELLIPKIESFLGQGRYADAVNTLRKLVRLEPDEAHCSGLAHLVSAELAADQEASVKGRALALEAAASIERGELIWGWAQLQTLSEILRGMPEGADDLRTSAAELQERVRALLETVEEAYARAKSLVAARLYDEAEIACAEGLAVCPAHPELLSLRVDAKETHRRFLLAEFNELEERVLSETSLERRLTTVESHADSLNSWAPHRMLVDCTKHRLDGVTALRSLHERLIDSGDLDVADRCQRAIQKLQPASEFDLHDELSAAQGIVPRQRWQRRIEHLFESGQLQAARAALQQGISGRAVSERNSAWEHNIESQTSERQRALLEDANAADRAIVRALQLMESSAQDANDWLNEALQITPGHALALFLSSKIALPQPQETTPKTPPSRTREVINKLAQLHRMVLRHRPGSRTPTPVDVPGEVVVAASAFADSPPSKPATSTPVTPTPAPTPLPPAQIPSPVVTPLPARSRTPGIVPRWKFNEYSVIAGSCVLLLVVIFGLTRLLTNKPSSLKEATQRARTESESPQQSPESVTPEPPKSAPQSSAARVFTDLPPGGSIKLDGVELGKSSGAEIVGNLQVGKRLLEIDAGPLGKASFRFAVNDQGAPLFPEQSPVTGLKALGSDRLIKCHKTFSINNGLGHTWVWLVGRSRSRSKLRISPALTNSCAVDCNRSGWCCGR